MQATQPTPRRPDEHDDPRSASAPEPPLDERHVPVAGLAPLIATLTGAPLAGGPQPNDALVPEWAGVVIAGQRRGGKANDMSYPARAVLPRPCHAAALPHFGARSSPGRREGPAPTRATCAELRRARREVPAPMARGPRVVDTAYLEAFTISRRFGLLAYASAAFSLVTMTGGMR
ncbi:hypothetical protein QFZ26_001780 [Agromyces ramosus]|uniref:Uncharacterized protein n=1 Tax=Agromyces ramosus TaxID=33879 RepID=A0ABU0R836_9MICO|nr:hypothetical protein [Agromyces ramosus]